MDTGLGGKLLKSKECRSRHQKLGEARRSLPGVPEGLDLGLWPLKTVS